MNTCPCCGYKVFERNSNYEVCPICFWEDDAIQSADPWFYGGANAPSLVEAQKNYCKFGAMDERFLRHVRKPSESDNKDPEWRLVDESDREFVTTPSEIEDQLNNNRVIPYDYWKRNV